MNDVKTRRFIHESYYEDGRLKDKGWFLYVTATKVTMQFKVTFMKDDVDWHDHKDNQGRKYMATDIGFHSPKPNREGHKPMDGYCQWTGGDCYYDGTSLGAQEFAQSYGIDDNDTIFDMLQDRHDSWFGDDAIIEDATPLKRLSNAVKEATNGE